MFALKNRIEVFVGKNGFSIVQTLNALAAAIMWLYFVSHGFSQSSLLDAVYEIQARSLGQGHLFIVPGPLERFYHDSLMFWGRYYFYWGLFPSLCLLLVGKLIGHAAAHYVITGLFFFSLIYFFQKILLELTGHAAFSRAEPDIYQNGAVLFFTWLLIFVLPFPVQQGWFFERFMVYEQQILFGLAIAMPGLFFLIRALYEKKIEKLALSALFLSLAAWTRVTWVPFALLLLAATPFFQRRWQSLPAARNSKKNALALLATASALMAGLLCLNYFRFDSFFDFGVKYQNPSFYPYLRNLKMFFSPLTRFINTVFNVMSYYAPWDFIQLVGLEKKSFSLIEKFPPGFFYVNPQFIPLLVTVPFGIYKAFRDRSPLLASFAVLLVATVYLNLLIGFFGTMIILRYFIEFYYLLILTFFASLLVFFRPKIAALILGMMLIFYVPGTLKSYATVQPKLRPLKSSLGIKSDRLALETPSARPAVQWPPGRLSSGNRSQFPFYSVIGIAASNKSELLARDIFAVYMLPKTSPLKTSPRVSITGIRPIHQKGDALIYFENRLIGTVKLRPGSAIDCSFDLPYKIPRVGPYQILVVFLPYGNSFLPARSPENNEIAFQEILFEATPANAVSTLPHPRPTRNS